MLLPNCPLSDGSQQTLGHSCRHWALSQPPAGAKHSWTDRLCHSESLQDYRTRSKAHCHFCLPGPAPLWLAGNAT